MSEGWHYLAFGMELGPMSWDDLRERAARGDLRPDNQLRQGAAGNWTPAGEIAGLFAPRAGERAEDDAWYCEILGAELGPMSSSELRLLAERGNLKGDNRVRRGAEGEWVLASSRAELAPLVGVEEKETDFELASGQAVERPADVASCAAVVPGAAVGSRDGCTASVNAADDPAGDAPPPSDKRADATPKQIRETREPKPTRPKPPRQPILFDIPYRLLGGVAAAAALAAVIVGGYFAYLRTATPAPDYRQVASAYRQVYEQLKQFRQDPRSRSPVGMQFQFSRSVAALRKQLESASPDSPGAKLGQAGSQLSEMLNSFSAQPGSPEESKFAASEQQFLKIIDDVAAGLPK